ncbi:MAG: Dimethylmenaquinone methyltransferase [Bradyrhizobium sp.]|nr:Dimethylmenaquinone methyltransferase [Bradyrhizobium sp.]
MFYVRAMPSPLSAALLEKAARVETAILGHLRFTGFPRKILRPVGSSKRIVGTAVTLALPGFDSALLHHAAGLVRPGDVLVIDRLGDERYACLGGGVAVSLVLAGAAGVILDGPCTDPEEVRQSGLPLWATGTSALTTRIAGIGGEMNYPVSIGGVAVLPGALVIADESGIVFLNPEEADAGLDEALTMQAGEPVLLAQVSRERQLGEVTGASDLVRARLAPVNGSAGAVQANSQLFSAQE